MRQVAHALLTRPPLSASASFQKIPQMRPARLACVKHAASVHPEPGSNSHVKAFAFRFYASGFRFFVQSGIQNQLLANSFPVLTVVWFVYFRIRSEFSQIRGLQTRPFLLEFSGSYILFNLWFSRFTAVSFLESSLFMIPYCFRIVNNFFHFFGFF